MKKAFRILGLVALIAIVGFSMAACSDDSGGDDGGNTPGGNTPGGGGDTLAVSGQVYEVTYERGGGRYDDIIYTPYTGSMTVTDGLSCGSGGIVNGQLSYTLGPPTNIAYTVKSLFGNELGFGKSDLTVTPSDAKCTFINFNAPGFFLEKKEESVKAPGDPNVISIKNIEYMYFDKACTVTATGGTFTEGDRTTILPGINFSFKRGWNVLYSELETTWRSGNKQSAINKTISTSVGDRVNVKWSLVGR